MKATNLITAIVTPFDTQNHIDYAALEQLTEALLNHGSRGFVIGGTTGEGPTLTDTEKITLYEHFATFVNGRVPVIANVGSNNTVATIEMAQQVGQIAGIDALLTVVPYYNKPDQAGMVAHFTAIADTSPLPLVLYNIPGRTGVTMIPETVITLAEHENIAGIKQCGSLPELSAIIAGTPDDFIVWTGEDEQFITAATLGADGVISVASHLYGDTMQAAYQALKTGDLTQVAHLQQWLLPKMAALFAWPSPAPVKAVLNAQGFSTGVPRLPLLPLTEAQQTQLAQLLDVATLDQIKEGVTA
ncbi:4-hydroxy-tetrahydrodipicolinate synthase [Lacticaseibacillus saniviri]|uniref:4-hydroxy-tetrahydrodipicolinate synthase n=1 Tax=Lacticaseibacillus saniviri JCM 17471 = DSM 24301 TaxID=1293598 RepID=A0A0R2MSB9_9LACO|nr:4-hydroxy-tetrahydrodipicolinate synthase [Lacticaseibacillus saniviri]KRO16471.1 Dihydrodipicolinate synthase N-acetylneuraminate lyase [Lacticaseibacillus saniviri JCM 17471 = DSM 24301]MCG4282007.1 4-hydroxy-tetrahydrodipicolinate synthase [Lacticaseibacillus saniviri]